MSSSSPLPQRIRQRFVKKHYCFSTALVCFCCLSAVVLLIVGAIELYKLKTFIVRQCHVKSVDVIQRDDRFYPRWTIQVRDEERITIEYMFGSTGFSSASWAWNSAEKYMVELQFEKR